MVTWPHAVLVHHLIFNIKHPERSRMASGKRMIPFKTPLSITATTKCLLNRASLVLFSCPPQLCLPQQQHHANPAKLRHHVKTVALPTSCPPIGTMCKVTFASVRTSCILTTRSGLGSFIGLLRLFLLIFLYIVGTSRDSVQPPDI